VLAVLRILLLVLGFVACAHLVACAAYSVGVASVRLGKVSWLSQGFQGKDVDDVANMKKYIHFMYWSLVTLTTAGYGARPHLAVSTGTVLRAASPAVCRPHCVCRWCTFALVCVCGGICVSIRVHVLVTCPRAPLTSAVACLLAM
jgi:hypothetical protein